MHSIILLSSCFKEADLERQGQKLLSFLTETEKRFLHNPKKLLHGAKEISR
jgi:hypothetical protein